ncbi:hypothetical protein T484DRAFT_1881004, partial [Baffinella frigidus]
RQSLQGWCAWFLKSLTLWDEHPVPGSSRDGRDGRPHHARDRPAHPLPRHPHNPLRYPQPSETLASDHRRRDPKPDSSNCRPRGGPQSKSSRKGVSSREDFSTRYGACSQEGEQILVEVPVRSGTAARGAAPGRAGRGGPCQGVAPGREQLLPRRRLRRLARLPGHQRGDRVARPVPRGGPTHRFARHVSHSRATATAGRPAQETGARRLFIRHRAHPAARQQGAQRPRAAPRRAGRVARRITLARRRAAAAGWGGGGGGRRSGGGAGDGDVAPRAVREEQQVAIPPLHTV